MRHVGLAATKIGAFRSRGAGDFYASHAIQDILAVLNGRLELVDEVVSSQAKVRSYLVETFAAWLEETAFSNALEGHVEFGRETIA